MQRRPTLQHYKNVSSLHFLLQFFVTASFLVGNVTAQWKKAKWDAPPYICVYTGEHKYSAAKIPVIGYYGTNPDNGGIDFYKCDLGRQSQKETTCCEGDDWVKIISDGSCIMPDREEHPAIEVGMLAFKSYEETWKPSHIWWDDENDHNIEYFQEDDGHNGCGSMTGLKWGSQPEVWGRNCITMGADEVKIFHRYYDSKNNFEPHGTFGKFRNYGEYFCSRHRRHQRNLRIGANATSMEEYIY